MPKMKTNRAAAKRFKVTGTGKLKRAIFWQRKQQREKEISENLLSQTQQMLRIWRKFYHIYKSQNDYLIGGLKKWQELKVV